MDIQTCACHNNNDYGVPGHFATGTERTWMKDYKVNSVGHNSNEREFISVRVEG